MGAAVKHGCRAQQLNCYWPARPSGTLGRFIFLMHALSSTRILATAVAFGVCGFASAHAQVFTDLTAVHFNEVAGVASTFQGPLVVGRGGAFSDSFDVLRWTRSTGAVVIPGLPSDGYPFRPEDISASGKVIVGRGAGVFEPVRPTAYRWTSESGAQPLTHNIRDAIFSVRTRVSGDGSTVSGFGASYAFRWTQETGTVFIGGKVDEPVTPDNPIFFANALSWDGSVIAGMNTLSPFELGEASLWTEQTGLVGLGFLFNNGAENSTATGITGDGRIVVGTGITDGYSEAFRWTEGGGMVGLGVVNGGARSFANGISADGGRIFGGTIFANNPFQSDPFVWEAHTGVRRLVDVLADRGAGDELTGWQLRDIMGFSADGRYVVGRGVGPGGGQSFWLADLGVSPVPEPSTIGLFAAAGLLTFAALRRRRTTTHASP